MHCDAFHRVIRGNRELGGIKIQTAAVIPKEREHHCQGQQGEERTPSNSNGWREGGGIANPTLNSTPLRHILLGYLWTRMIPHQYTVNSL